MAPIRYLDLTDRELDLLKAVLEQRYTELDLADVRPLSIKGVYESLISKISRADQYGN